MATCPSCHRDQDRPSAFCVHCGAVLDRPASAAPPASGKEQAAAARDAPAAGPRQISQAAESHVRRAETGDVGAYIVRRLLALVADLAVWGALLAIALAAWSHQAAPVRAMLGGSGTLLWWWLGAFAVLRWLFEGIAGSTPGKLVFGLGVAGPTGGTPGLARALTRTVVLAIDLAGIGFLLATLDPKRRRIGDFVAGTRVINTRIGALAPLLGLAIFGAAFVGVDAYAGGATAMAALGRDVATSAVALLNGERLPGVLLTPSPTPTPASAQAQSPAPTVSPLPVASGPPT